MGLDEESWYVGQVHDGRAGLISDITILLAGSTYTYFFHVLQLYLGTPHAKAAKTTRKLLFKMIGDSILFDHDRSEWNIWIDCVPRTHSRKVKPSATLSMERLQLLDFLDDCAKRCAQNPYRYFEHLATHAAESGVPNLEQGALASPLLFTVFEQLQAKLSGHHISSEAGAVIVQYIRTVIVSLLGKQTEVAYVRSLLERLGSCLDAIEAKREAKLPKLRAEVATAMEQLDVLTGTGAEMRDDALTFRPVEGMLNSATRMYAVIDIQMYCSADRGGSGRESQARAPCFATPCDQCMAETR